MTHATIPVHVPLWQYGFAAVVIFLGPVVGLALLRADRARAGLFVVLLAGLASLAFEGVFHFVIENADHVGTVERGRSIFTGTAILTTAGDLLLVLVAGWYLWRLPGAESGYSG